MQFHKYINRIISQVIPVMRALTTMAVRVIQDEQNETLRKDFHGSVILGKCLELLSDSQNHITVLTFLSCTAPLIGSHLENLWDPKLKKIINMMHNEPAARKTNDPYR